MVEHAGAGGDAECQGVFEVAHEVGLVKVDAHVADDGLEVFENDGVESFSNEGIVPALVGFLVGEVFLTLEVADLGEGGSVGLVEGGDVVAVLLDEDVDEGDAAGAVCGEREVVVDPLVGAIEGTESFIPIERLIALIRESVFHRQLFIMKRLLMTALVLLSPLSVSLLTGAERTVEEISKEFRKSNTEFSERYQAAKTPEERSAALHSRPSTKDFVAEIKPLLLAQADDPEIAEYTAYTLYTSRVRGCEELVAVIAKHRESEFLAAALLVAPWDKSGKLTELREWARKESPHEKVKAVAAFHRASQEKDMPTKEIIAELNFAKNYPGELKVMGHDLKAQIDSLLHETIRLAIGQPAPEIEGEDVDGEKFTLSGHRGKVVVLTFWGDW